VKFVKKMLGFADVAPVEKCCKDEAREASGTNTRMNSEPSLCQAKPRTKAKGLVEVGRARGKGSRRTV
jgi:hypothetical protein